MTHNNQHFQKKSLESVNLLSYIADNNCRLSRYLLRRGKKKKKESWKSCFDIVIEILTLSCSTLGLY